MTIAVNSRARNRGARWTFTIVAIFLMTQTFPISLSEWAAPWPTRAAAATKTSPGTQLFYNNDFSGPVGPEWSTSLTDTTPCGEKFLGQFGGTSVSLSLNNLADHSVLTVTFDLFIIQSWDGTVTSSQGPDVWDLTVAGGETLLHTTFANNGDPQAYPGTFPGASNPTHMGATEVDTLGYTFDYGPEFGGILPNDSVYHLSFNFPHSSSSIQLVFTAALMPTGEPITDESWGLANFTVAGTVAEPKSATAGLTMTTAVSSGPVASGSALTYTTTVLNSGPEASSSVLVDEELNQSETFLSMATSQGSFTAATPNSPFSRVFALLGSIPAHGQATITLTIGVLSPAGVAIVNTADIFSEAADTKPASVTTATVVQGGGVALLSWDQPTPTTGDATPAPENLQIGPGTSSPTYTPSTGFSPVPAQTGPCALTRVQIYKSDSPTVQVSPGNLWGAPSETLVHANVPVAPQGSSFVLTNVWNCGGALTQSTASSVVTVPSGPAISKVKITSKLKISGTGFTGPVQVFVNGVGFAEPAAVGKTAVTQSGSLTDGTTISGLPNQPLLITVQNSDGGLASRLVVK
jgi:hypothetical protein